MLSESIQCALTRYNFELYAFVFMPEHVHILVEPRGLPTIDLFINALKRPFSYRIKQQLIASASGLLETLTVQERPGKKAFRFWQEGPGYDRNLCTPKALLASIDYIHRNPIRRGLCERVEQWKWSSARFFLSEGKITDPDLPQITKMAAHLFFDSKGN
jgi:putative transposase